MESSELESGLPDDAPAGGHSLYFWDGYIKLFYVRRFTNNVNRRMKRILYENLVEKSRTSLKENNDYPENKNSNYYYNY